MDPAPRRARWIPVVYAAGMLVVVAVNAAMIWVALTTDNGLVGDRPFARGLEYNRVLDEAARQRATGWNVEIAVEPAGPGAMRVVITAQDRDGAPLDHALVDGTLTRPVDRLEPVAVVAVERAPGVHEAVLRPPRAGQWDLHLQVRRGPDTVETQRRVFVP